jgi:hypothetical protein
MARPSDVVPGRNEISFLFANNGAKLHPVRIGTFLKPNLQEFSWAIGRK